MTFVQGRYPALGIWVPAVLIRMLYTEVLAVKYMVRLSAEPQAQLAGISGSVIVPRELEGMPEGSEVEVLLYDDD